MYWVPVDSMYESRVYSRIDLTFKPELIVPGITAGYVSITSPVSEPILNVPVPAFV